ncbi:MAG: FG-GAP-like repeat-containing protein [Bacteroidales bacterium]|nr:FG-GAP-like repeat-containing protein [Bacteroidales bacterium]
MEVLMIYNFYFFKKITFTFLLFFAVTALFCQVQFTNIAVTAGVNDGGNGQGVVSFDFNNDGLLDIYLTNNGQTNRLYKNLDGETFSDVAETFGVNYTGNGRGCAAGDYNNDGFTDLIIGNWQQMLILFRNDSTTFSNVTIEAGMNQQSYGGSINWFDYNNDGMLDCYVGNDGVPSHDNYLFQNEDLNSFTDIAASVGLIDGRSTLSVASADYDHDGDIDFFIGNQTGSPTGVLYRNDLTTFTDVSIASGLETSSYTWGADWGDFNNDGNPDLYLCNSNANNQCFINNGDGTFTESAFLLGIDDPSQSFSCGWADYDNDGDLDLYVSNGQTALDKLYRNEGLYFLDVLAEVGMAGNQHTGSITWGDFNNDGFLDLYLSNNGTANNLYVSNANNMNKWIVMKLQGDPSNKSAIGTRIRIVANGQSQIREVQGGSGHNGQHSLPVEFGIGQATIIDTVIVNWPSGLEQTITGIVPNQILSLTEGGVFTGTQHNSNRSIALDMQPNYPNPFTGTTYIPFYIPAPEHVKLVIYDQLNREVAILADQDIFIGNHTIEWDASGLEAGMYFCRLTAGNGIAVQKLIKK